MQWASVNVLAKKIKTDIFNKSPFAKRKSIVIIFFSSLFILGFR